LEGIVGGGGGEFNSFTFTDAVVQERISKAGVEQFVAKAEEFRFEGQRFLGHGELFSGGRIVEKVGGGVVRPSRKKFTKPYKFISMGVQSQPRAISCRHEDSSSKTGW
jgi:hypothetical protein